ncbi:Mrp/NBP35 family ATP-binding protein [soil metagenome]
MSGNSSSLLTEQDVLLALRGVKDPDIQRDLVDLGMIKDIRIGPESLDLTVNLTTPACPLKAKIEADVREALARNLGTARHVTVHMSADVRGKGVIEKGDIPGVKNVIAVGSGKGGVGKSTMAAAIAYGLQSYGANVGLMDADVYGPSIPHLVGATGRPMAQGERIQPIEANGLRLMSIGFLVEPERAVIMRGPMLHGIMQQFLHQVEWGELDYLVIDLPPGTGDVPLTLSQSLPLTGAVVVCTPQEVALLDARRAINMFSQLKVPMLGIIENMSYFDPPGGGERIYLFGHGGARRMAESMNVPFLGEVPQILNIRERGDIGKIHETLESDSPARPHLLGVVEQLAAQISIRNLKAPKMPKLEIIG